MTMYEICAMLNYYIYIKNVSLINIEVRDIIYIKRTM